MVQRHPKMTTTYKISEEKHLPTSEEFNFFFVFPQFVFITKQKQCKNKAVAFIFPFMVMFLSIVLMFCPLEYL